MGNPIKYSTSSTSGSYNKGNVAIGTNTIGFGPTSTTGWYPGVTPTGGNFVVMEVVDGNTPPRFYTPVTDNDWLRLARQEGAIGADTGSTANIKSWFASQANYVVTNIDFPLSTPNIVGNGLVLNLEAGISASYPGTGTTWSDISGLGNNAGLFNGVSFNNNGWLNFDGVDDYVYLNNPDRPPLLSPDNVSVNILFKVNTTSDGVLVRNRTYGYGLSLNNGGLVGFAYYDGGLLTNYDSGTGYIVTNKWYLATLTFGDSYFKIYLNGTQLSSNLSVGTNLYYPIGAKAVGIGRDADASGPYLNGSVSSVQIYNKSLSQAEVLQNYYQAPIVTDGLVFAADAGNLVSYESGSTTTYSLTGSISGSLINGTGYSNINNGTWVFDGVDDYTSLGNVFNYTSESFSFGYWVNFNSFNTNVPGQGPIIFYKGAFNTNGYYLQHSTTSFSFVTNQSGSSQTTTSVGVNTLGVWYYIVVTRNGSSVRGYVNGVDTTGTAGSHTNPASSTNDFTLARYAASIYFNGKLSNFTGYNRALTAAEVLQNFNAQRSRFGV